MIWDTPFGMIIFAAEQTLLQKLLDRLTLRMASQFQGTHAVHRICHQETSVCSSLS